MEGKTSRRLDDPAAVLQGVGSEGDCAPAVMPPIDWEPNFLSGERGETHMLSSGMGRLAFAKHQKPATCRLHSIAAEKAPWLAGAANCGGAPGFSCHDCRARGA